MRSDQKKLDEIKRIGEALAAGKPILTDQKKANIVKYAMMLGEDGETMVEELLGQVRELMDQLVATMRTVKEFISKLGKRAALHELSFVPRPQEGDGPGEDGAV
jgi:hypothetical protein